MPLINQDEIKGESKTGFEKRGYLGPFECRNCKYYKEQSCGQSDMMKYSQQPRTADGRVVVGAADCCEYVDRVGRIFFS